MPSGSRIVLRTAAEADIPTPDTDQSALFMDADAANEPAWKDDAGVVHSLQGGDGVLSYQDHGNTGATETVDASVADVHRLVANAATVTLTLSGAAASGTPTVIRLLLVQDGSGGRDWAFPGSVDFGGAEPTWTDRAGGVIDIVDLTTVDGGTVWIASFQPDGGGSSSLDAILTSSSGEDIADALTGAAAPDAGNVFATMADVGGGGAPAVTETIASGSTTMTNANTLYDGASVTPPAGTYFFLAKIIVTNNSGLVDACSGVLIVGATIIDDAFTELAAGIGPGGQITHTLMGKATVSGSDVVKVQAALARAGGSIVRNARANGGAVNKSTRIEYWPAS